MNNIRGASLLAAAGVAAVALTGCHRTVVPNFGPWPVGYAQHELEPGTWVAQGWTPKCTSTLTQGAYTITSHESVVNIPDAPGVTFSSTGCGIWQFANGGQGRTS